MRFLCIYKPAKAQGAHLPLEMMETMGNFIVAGLAPGTLPDAQGAEQGRA
jgi:hypothetical protein